MNIIKIDLDELLDQAVHHMSNETDLKWPIGAALEDLYWNDWIFDFQSKMCKVYNSAQRTQDSYHNL